MSLFLYFISAAMMGVLTHFYFNCREYDKDGKNTLVLKGLGTLIPVLLCFYAIVSSHGLPFQWLLLAGLVICMTADIMIELAFVVGMFTFLAAHLCFITYFFILEPFNGNSILLFAVLLLFAVSVFWKYIPKIGKNIVPYSAYTVVLSFMLSVAMMLPFSAVNAGTVCIAAGSGLFFISDSILADCTLGETSKRKERLVMYLYYPAVYLLAVSAFYI